MPKENYIFDILTNLYPSLKIELREENFGHCCPSKANHHGRIFLTEESEILELELEVYFAGIILTSIRPYRGIVSSGPPIPYFGDPRSHGYMDLQGNLSQKGSYYLFKMLRDILNIYRIVRNSPNTILELYAVCYSKIRENDPAAEFGKLDLNSGTLVTKSLGNVVMRRYGFVTDTWSIDLAKSFQNIVGNHPEIFQGELN